VSCRLAREEYDELVRLANQNNMTRNDYIRRELQRAIKRTRKR